MDKTLSGYLDQVDRRLRPLPAGERADIILEIRSEILELEAAGAAPEEILSRLGEARGLAAAYLGDTISKKHSQNGWRRPCAGPCAWGRWRPSGAWPAWEACSCCPSPASWR